MAPTGGAIEVPAVKKPRVDCVALEPGALQKGLTFWDKRLPAATAKPGIGRWEASEECECEKSDVIVISRKYF